MPYLFLDDVATADAAFECCGESLEELFMAAAHAMLSVMLDHPETLAQTARKRISLAESSLDMLLYAFLQELIYYKDAENLFLVPEALTIEKAKGEYRLSAMVAGEEIDDTKHDLLMDVKSATMHLLTVEATEKGWQATVVLDL